MVSCLCEENPLMYLNAEELEISPPGAVIPKNKTKLVIAKIRDVTSYGMLCSESELNLSDESDGITELSSSKYFYTKFRRGLN